MQSHARKPFDGATPSGWRWVILAGCVLALVSVYLSATTAWRTTLRPKSVAAVAVPAAPVAVIAPGAPSTPSPSPATPAALPTTLPSLAASATQPAEAGATSNATAELPSSLQTASRPPPPGPNYIWVEGYRRSDGTYVKGYWRATSRK
jgi:hypothetical protein